MTDDEPLKPLDYVILGLIRNGIKKLSTLQKRLKKTGEIKITSSFNKLMKLGYVENHPDDGWADRNFNPTLVLSDKGKKETEMKIDQLREEWNNLVLLYENKDKEKLSQGMGTNRMFMPFMIMMGISNGLMLGSMLNMNDMVAENYFANMDFAYDMGYADGVLDGEGGDFADGSEGGFMDDGFDVGF